MQQEADVVQDLDGNAVAGAAVQVLVKATGELAKLFADDEMKEIANPVYTDANGRYAWKAANGKYKSNVIIGGRVFVGKADITLFDPADDGAAGDIRFIQAGVGAVPRKMQDELRERASVTQFGAKGDGVTDDKESITAAKSIGPVTFPFGDYVDTGNGESYLYTAGLKQKGGAYRYAWGGTLATVQDYRPVMMVEKFITTPRNAAGSGGWDSGALMGIVHKKGGDAFVSAITGHVRAVSGAGDAIAIHGRAGGNEPNVSEIFGGWFYADINPTDGTKILEGIGIEINMRNRGAAPSADPSLDPMPTGTYRGLIINTADGSKACHVALDIGAQTSTGSEGWYTGVKLRQDGIVPSSLAGFDTEQLLIEGGSTSAKRYGGIKYGKGYFDYGINLQNVTGINNNVAIALKLDHKIQWENLTTSKYIVVRSVATSLVDFNNLTIGVNGLQVAGARKLGWGAPTGVTDKTSFATYVAPAISATPTQAEVQAVANAAQATSRHLAALINDLIAHGLIGPTP